MVDKIIPLFHYSILSLYCRKDDLASAAISPKRLLEFLTAFSVNAFSREMPIELFCRFLTNNTLCSCFIPKEVVDVVDALKRDKNVQIFEQFRAESLRTTEV